MLPLIVSWLGAREEKKAAEHASDAQIKMAHEAIEEQKRQFDAMRKLQEPYMTTGSQALGGYGNLLGLNGADAQRQAIAGIENSPFFQSQYKQAENALLQNAAATGGLRGGNVQEALADNRMNMLYQNVQNQQQNLASLASLGQNASAGVGNAGINTGNNVANQLNGIGQAQAGYQLAKGQTTNKMLNTLFTGLGVLGKAGGIF